MDNLSGDIIHLEGDFDMVVSKILSNWDCWTHKKPFEDGQDSPQCASPESSLDSMCSSPETPTSSSGCNTFLNFPCPQQKHSSTSPKKPPKPKMSTKRRMKASEREKMRMRSLADALHQLRDYLPPDYSQRGQPLTKIQTLKYTIQYINELSDLLSST
ncbi:mesogenin-1 [Megalops cyprinoides]|uniref:mesogenin-1 n=1 Tax=Megalops cyprinoides TaxID=118141 RepID=UPI001864498D|nr:mesogenin-1 [Megalops cyprinoides]